MIDIECLDEKYSTTKLVTKEKPKVVNNPEDKFETVVFLPESESRKGEGELRTKGYFKKSYKDKPLISIVTVVYNGEQFLEETIQSVINQSYDNIEYIIIDGGSTDGTVDIIKKYEDKIDYWVSEKDNGIYDAMNKGIKVATGKWINFMNAGDMLYEDQVIEDIFFDKSYPNSIFVYGDTSYNYGSFTVLRKSFNLDIYWKRIPFRHQSVFIDSVYHKKEQYRLHIKINSDFEFFYRSFRSYIEATDVQKAISIVSVDGVSDDKRIAVLLEKMRVINFYDPTLEKNVFFIKSILLEIIKQSIKLIIPNKLIRYIQKLKSTLQGGKIE